MADTQLDRLYYTVDADIAPYQQKMADLGKTSQQAGTVIKSNFKESADHVERMGRGVEVSRRELLYLGREAIAGDMGRLPGTLLLIATHLAGISTAAILMGTAVIGPFALMATAAIQAERAQERVRLAITATGYAAGITATQVAKVTTAIGNDPTSGLSVRGATDAAAILLRGGNVSGGNLDAGVRAAAAYGTLSGKTSDQAATEISKIMEDPAKAAKDLHDQLKLLSDAEMVRIMGMKDQDQQEAALFDALNRRGQDAANSLWSLSKWWDSFKSGASNFWFNTGGQAQTSGSRVASIQAMISSGGYRDPFSGEFQTFSSSQITDLQRQLVQARQQMIGENYKSGAGYNQTQADRAAADAVSPGAMELRKLQDEARISGLPEDQREMARAQAEASRQRDLNRRSTEPGVASRADAIYGASITAAQAEQTAKLNDEQKSRTLEMQKRAMDEINKQTEEAMNEVRSQQTMVANDRKRQLTTMTTRADSSAAGLGTDIQTLQLEADLRGRDSTEIDRQVALLKEKNELVKDGWDLTNQDGQDELALMDKLINKQYDLLQAKKDATELTQNKTEMTDRFTDFLGNLALNPRSAWKTAGRQLSGDIFNYGVLNPIKNKIPTMFGGEEGHAPTLTDFLKGPSGTLSNPMYVYVVNNPGGANMGLVGAGAGGLNDIITGALGQMMDMKIGQATPGILANGLDFLSQAISRGFTPGAIGAGS